MSKFLWSNIHSYCGSPPIRFQSRDFPPLGLFDEAPPFILTLIPLVAHSGQLGFMVFGSEQLGLYGAIVQQLGGAFNTARLYRQAIEDRQLAEEANRMKSRFLSTISHELRTPLNLIVGLSGLLLQENEEGDSPLSEPVQRDVERIQAYAQHLGGLIGDVLDLATSDAGQLRLNMDFVELGQAFRMVTQSGRQLANESDSGLDIDALKVVAAGINSLRSPQRAIVLVTHYQRLLDYVVPDQVHVLADGRIARSGGRELAIELERTGYGTPADYPGRQAATP